MASERNIVPLDQVYEFSSGLSKPRSDFGSGYPFLSFKDVFYNIFVPRKLNESVNSTEHERVSRSIRRGDVFLTRTSETLEELGMSCVALEAVPGATFNGFTKRLRPKSDTQVVPEYAGYFFRSPQFRREVTAMSSLSTRASLNNEMLARLTIMLPPVREQAAIGCILKGLDDKIEVNRRMSETIEGIARTIFRSWFLDFDPVHARMEGRETGLPRSLADLFPDKLVQSELGEIPEGWQLLSLDDIGRFVNGLALQKYPPTNGSSLPVIKIAQLRIGNAEGADRASADLAPDYVVEDGDILFSWSGSLECVLWAGGRGALNQHLFKVTSLKYPKWLCYFGIHQHLEEFRHIAAGKATTMGHIQRHHLADAKLAVPEPELLRAADSVLTPMIESIWRREVESRSLVKLRNTLLPRLISGELEVDKTVSR